MKCTSSSRGSTSALTSDPLTVIVICIVTLPSGTFDGAAQRAQGQLAGEMELVLGGAPLVPMRPAGFGRQPGGLAHGVLGGRLPDEVALGLLAQKCGAPTAVRPMPASATTPSRRTVKAPAPAAAQSLRAA